VTPRSDHSPRERSTPDTGAPASYDLKSVDLPYLTGLPLRLVAALMEGPLGNLITSALLTSAGITWLRDQIFEEPPSVLPLHRADASSEGPVPVPPAIWHQEPQRERPGFRFRTVADYARAYREGTSTPTEVAGRYLAAVSQGDRGRRPLRAIVACEKEDVLRQAEESTRRFREGRSLSILDGVPVAVKDELDLEPYRTTVGTAFLGGRPAPEDATVVARMRSMGALLVGKANMHEIGIGVTGLNRIHGTPRNPYSLDRFTGGSSSGPAAAVAAGLCPVAIGADGGGSIRIPASFCGIVGLKPTFGRLSEHGAAPLCWSVAHLGPLGATVTDAALAYAAMAGPDPKDRLSMRQPTPKLDGWDEEGLAGLALGVYWPWFRHATTQVVASCERMLAALEERGAAIREVSIPDLEAARLAHTITIASEMALALSPTYARHRRDHGLDVRLNLAMARRFTATDYVQAQRVRTRLMAGFADAFASVDAVITPSTGLVAPAISARALRGGESDLSTLIEIMRFATPANLTGLPAISFPAGYADDRLPVGMQAIGRAWEEPTLLRIALAAEDVLERQKPDLFFDLLDQSAN